MSELIGGIILMQEYNNHASSSWSS
jgi:hypothetical protein